jgi:predicted GH43/DUF377 family glycosyl hydrolase
LNARFWNLMTPDYVSNCLAWERADQPILPPTGDGWKSVWTANPDFVSYRGRNLLLYRANGPMAEGEVTHDRIGGAEVMRIAPGELELQPLGGDLPLIDVGPEEFDSIDVLDPAAVVFKDRLWVYYSAIGPGEDSIGLAVSDDGETFTKVGRIMTGRAPDVIVKDGRISMIYQLTDASGAYQLHLAASDDGVSFGDVLSEPIFPRTPNSWDSLSIVTARLSEDDGTYYMVFGGSAYLADEPEYFGLARSSDLIHWEPHPGNPIFGCGKKGAPDGGAMWFPALCETTDGGFAMLYEGSRGKYAFDVSSAICMAWVSRVSLAPGR